MGMPLTAIDKAFRILDLLVDHPEGLRPADLIRSTGYPSGTIHRLLGILARNGYVRQDAANGHYILGFKFAEAFNAMTKGLGLGGRALPHLKRLAQTTQHSANLGILNSHQVIYLESIIGEKSGPVMYSPPGTLWPAHCTGQGKVILADLPKPDLRRILQSLPLTPITPNTITSPSHLEDHLEEVSRRGFAVDDEESGLGFRCVAAPVRDHQGRVIAAVSVSAVAQMLPPENIPTVAEQVMAAAHALSSDLGYQPPTNARTAAAAGSPRSSAAARTGNSTGGDDQEARYDAR
jgi:DNA-binding IclR family transcriptional regulator